MCDILFDLRTTSSENDHTIAEVLVGPLALPTFAVSVAYSNSILYLF